MEAARIASNIDSSNFFGRSFSVARFGQKLVWLGQPKSQRFALRIKMFERSTSCRSPHKGMADHAFLSFHTSTRVCLSRMFRLPFPWRAACVCCTAQKDGAQFYVNYFWFRWMCAQRQEIVYRIGGNMNCALSTAFGNVEMKLLHLRCGARICRGPNHVRKCSAVFTSPLLSCSRLELA